MKVLLLHIKGPVHDWASSKLLFEETQYRVTWPILRIGNKNSRRRNTNSQRWKI